MLADPRASSRVPKEALGLLKAAVIESDERLALRAASELLPRLRNVTPDEGLAEAFSGFRSDPVLETRRTFAECAAKLAPADALRLTREFLQKPENVASDYQSRRRALAILQCLTPRVGDLDAPDMWEQIAEWIPSGPFRGPDYPIGTADEWSALVRHMPPDVAARMLADLLPREEEAAFSRENADAIINIITPRLSLPVLSKLSAVQVAMVKARPWRGHTKDLIRTLELLPESEARPGRLAAFEATEAELAKFAGHTLPKSLAPMVAGLADLVGAMPADDREPCRLRLVEAFLRAARLILRDPSGNNAELIQRDLHSSIFVMRPFLDPAAAGELGALFLVLTREPRLDATAWNLLAALAPQLDRATARSVLSAYVRTNPAAPGPLLPVTRGELMFVVVSRLDPVADADVLEESCRQLTEVFRSTKDRVVERAAGRMMVTLAARLGYGRHDADLCQVIRQELSRMAIAYSLVRIRGVILGLDNLTLAVQAVTDPRQLAELLDHPACFGLARGVLLDRLEELCLPDPPAERLRFALSPFGVAPTLPGLFAHPRMREKSRHFHTPWEAVEWLGQHPAKPSAIQ